MEIFAHEYFTFVSYDITFAIIALYDLTLYYTFFYWQSELPEAEQDNGGSTESVKEQEMKWSDLALQSLHENTPNIGT